MIKIKIPATSANLGAGFDALGLALSYYNYVNMEEADGCHIKSLDDTEVPTDETNLIYHTAKTVYEICGKDFKGLTSSRPTISPWQEVWEAPAPALLQVLWVQTTLWAIPFHLMRW